MQYVINNTYHSVIKASPAKLLFGFEQRSHADHLLARFVKQLSEVDSDLEDERESARDTASKAMDLIRSYNKEYRDAN